MLGTVGPSPDSHTHAFAVTFAERDTVQGNLLVGTQHTQTGVWAAGWGPGRSAASAWLLPDAQSAKGASRVPAPGPATCTGRTEGPDLDGEGGRRRGNAMRCTATPAAACCAWSWADLVDWVSESHSEIGAAAVVAQWESGRVVVVRRELLITVQGLLGVGKKSIDNGFSSGLPDQKSSFFFSRVLLLCALGEKALRRACASLALVTCLYARLAWRESLVVISNSTCNL